MKLKHAYPLIVTVTLLGLSACNSVTDASGTSGTSATPSYGATPSSANSNTSPSTGAAQRSYATDALLFVGSGTWATEVSNLRSILNTNGASYREVTSAQLNAMSVDEIATYGILIFPGGAGGTEAGSLSAQTHANLREAVQKRGVSYIGFCAGAFIAEAPAPVSGGDVSYGLGVVDGPVLDYYYLENQGTDIAMTLASFPDGSTRDILWYGGPVTPNIPGGVVAKYPDGNPMITQVWSGSGLVMMVGTHPTANQATLSALGVSSSDGTHQDYAWTLIRAALDQKPLQAF